MFALIYLSFSSFLCFYFHVCQSSVIQKGLRGHIKRLSFTRPESARRKPVESAPAPVGSDNNGRNTLLHEFSLLSDHRSISSVQHAKEHSHAV